MAIIKTFCDLTNKQKEDWNQSRSLHVF